MTSILGVKAKTALNKDIIVIGADTQVSVYRGNRMISKEIKTKKIWTGDWGVIARSGGAEDSEELRDFYDLFKEREKRKPGNSISDIITRAITPNAEGERVFEEVNQLNRRLIMKKYISPSYEFVLATINPSPSLWYVDDRGNVLDFDKLSKVYDIPETRLEHVTIGSGERKLERAIERKMKNKRGGINTLIYTPTELLLFVRESLHSALSVDPNTGGRIDIVAILGNKVFDYGRRIQKRLDDEERDEYENIGEELDEILEKEKRPAD